MNWAKEEAARIINSEGFRDTPADVIAAALQQVADQCAAVTSTMSNQLAHSAANAIRARFPRESNAK